MNVMFDVRCLMYDEHDVRCTMFDVRCGMEYRTSNIVHRTSKHRISLEKRVLSKVTKGL